MVGRLVSFWDGLFSEAMLVLGMVLYYMYILEPFFFHHLALIGVEVRPKRPSEG